MGVDRFQGVTGTMEKGAEARGCSKGRAASSIHGHCKGSGGRQHWGQGLRVQGGEGQAA